MNLNEQEHKRQLREKANGRVEASRLRKKGHIVKSPEQQEAHRKYAEMKAAMELEGDTDKRHYSVQLCESHFNTKVSPKVKGLLFVLSTLLETKSGGKIVDRKYHNLSIEEIAEKLGKTPNTLRPVIREAVEVGLLKEESEGQGHANHYTLSKDIYQSGSLDRRVNNFTKVIHASVQEVSKQMSLETLGYLSDVINFIHPKLHILVLDPLEPCDDYLEILEPKDLEVLLDMKEGKGNRLVNDLISLEVLQRHELGDRKTRSRVKVLMADGEFFTKSTKTPDMNKIKKAVFSTTLTNKNKANLSKTIEK
ncbi:MULTISPECIES: hypothetical protein [Bacillus cereus group]|uniref:Uncharacterized protein n=1 Tax=Bacillus thuringiensis serovar mexicanensis TaxID=180868 RepID=A0A242W7J0_BACTU|nr:MULTISPECIES: hypothetical protein [Bacillus cereus group]EEM57895.1 hypothetical protein bthur0007_43260 [Bacillus thuringiensis serovar monterrey BGSC 4AJ1]MEB9668782.1 hypothetical protein [Bacillus anthracis]OTW48123.1 hypothetical protein BK699_13155 [Bacillus thuringiensis serovar mexicanensis]OTW97784.1 hypothetical protein BK705_28585 [Bacillus thuringiensis serovar monterrey]